MSAYVLSGWSWTLIWIPVVFLKLSSQYEVFFFHHLYLEGGLKLPIMSSLTAANLQDLPSLIKQAACKKGDRRGIASFLCVSQMKMKKRKVSLKIYVLWTCFRNWNRSLEEVFQARIVNPRIWHFIHILSFNKK